MRFKIEVLNEKGEVIEYRYVDVSESTVEQALDTLVVKKIKRDAKSHGLGFRISKCEE